MFCKVYDKIISFIENKYSQQIIYEWAILEIMALVLIYESSSLRDLFYPTLSTTKKMAFLVHQTFLAICSLIISNVDKSQYTNPWICTLNSLIASKYQLDYDFAMVISGNKKFLIGHIYSLISLFPRTSQASAFHEYLKDLSKVNLPIVHSVFKNKIISYSNSDSSVIFCKNKFQCGPQVKPPFIKSDTKYRFTLVLDLDETLIHFKVVNILTLGPRRVEGTDAHTAIPL